MVAESPSTIAGNGEEQVIKLKDGGPWGFRLGGGAEFGCPIQVAKVRVNSKSYYAGLEEGDILTKVADRDVTIATHANVMSMIEHGGDNLTLTILRGVHSLDSLYERFVEVYNQKQKELARAHLIRSKETSPSRTLHVLKRSGSKERQPGVGRASTLLMLASPDSHQAEYKTFRSSSEDRNAILKTRKGNSDLPPSSPRSASQTTTGNLLTTVTLRPHATQISGDESVQVDVSDSQQQNFTPKYSVRGRSNSQPIIVPIKPMSIQKQQKEAVEFKVRNVNAPKEVWRPSNDQSTLRYNQMGEVTQYPPNPYTRVTATDSERERRFQKPPANFYWELMENQPTHMPGYNDPLIVDDTQGDFGGNPIIHPEKKLYSDSNFFQTENSIYPTINEQMRLAKMISGNLEAPDAMRSRGGKMFFKRKQKAGEWTKESVGQRHEPAYNGGGPDFYDLDGNHYWPSRMKENIDKDELERLEHNTENISKHDLLPPVVAFDINSALKRSKNHGKGVEIFAKKKEIADQHTIDETNRQTVSHSNVLDSQVEKLEEATKSYKSPWNAAWEGNLERAFATVDPCAAQSCKDEQYLRKDENPHQLNYDHIKASFAVKYKDITPVRPPTGPDPLRRNLSYSTPALNADDPKPQPRLATMIAPREEENTTFDTYTYKWCMPSYYGRDLINASVDERMRKSQYGTAGWYRRPGEFTRPLSYSAAGGSLQDVHLLRPKEYIRPHHTSSLDDEVFEEPTPTSHIESFGGSMTNLKRPKDFIDPSLCDDPMNQSYSYATYSTPQSHSAMSPAHSHTGHITAF